MPSVTGISRWITLNPASSASGLCRMNRADSAVSTISVTQA